MGANSLFSFVWVMLFLHFPFSQLGQDVPLLYMSSHIHGKTLHTHTFQDTRGSNQGAFDPYLDGAGLDRLHARGIPFRGPVRSTRGSKQSAPKATNVQSIRHDAHGKSLEGS